MCPIDALHPTVPPWRLIFNVPSARQLSKEPTVWDDPSLTEDSDLVTAFIELTRVYALAGEIERDAHSLQSIRGYDDPSQSQRLHGVVSKLDADMDAWVRRLPDCVRLAENVPASRSVFLLVMLGRITLFAATINLRE